MALNEGEIASFLSVRTRAQMPVRDALRELEASMSVVDAGASPTALCQATDRLGRSLDSLTAE